MEHRTVEARSVPNLGEHTFFQFVKSYLFPKITGKFFVNIKFCLKKI